MTRTSVPADPNLSGKSFLPATLDTVQRCPARSDYLELRFTTAAGSWHWCFPAPSQYLSAMSAPVRRRGNTGQRAATSLALTFGRYGAQARLVHHGELGTALPSSEALPMILAGAQILVERRLVITGPAMDPIRKGPAA